MEMSKRTAIEHRLDQIIRLNNGRITPDAVIEDARSKKSPLHDQFEWDDSKAAHQYRLEQAREIIRSVKMEIVTSERIVSTVRYIRDPSATGKEQGYVEVSKIRDERSIASDALRSECGRLSAMVERVEGLASALGLHKEFEQFKLGVDLLSSRVLIPAGDAARGTARLGGA